MKSFLKVDELIKVPCPKICDWTGVIKWTDDITGGQKKKVQSFYIKRLSKKLVFEHNKGDHD